MEKKKKLPNPAYVEALAHTINDANWFPKHIGLRLERHERGKSVFTLNTMQHHLQPFGVVHGGNIASLIDTAAFWAVWFSIDDPLAGLTSIDLKLNYLSPATMGRLYCEGNEIRSGRSICYAEARVMNERGELVAHGTSTLMVLPGKGIDLSVTKFLEK